MEALKEKKQYPYVLILAKTEVKNAEKIKNEFPNIRIQNFIKDNFFLGNSLGVALRQGPTLFLGLSSLEEVENVIKYLKQNSISPLALLKNSRDAYLIEELEKKKFLGVIYFFAFSIRFQKSLKFFLFLCFRKLFTPKINI